MLVFKPQLLAKVGIQRWRCFGRPTGGLDESAIAVKVRSKPTASKASRRDGGSGFPRLSARRRIPRQAVPLKKYRCGTSPVSKMSDNEHATAALGYSKVLSVKNPVCGPIPELPQHCEEGSKRPSLVNRQDAGDVLPNQPSGPQPASQSSKFNRKLATRSIHSCSETGDAEILARCSSDQKVDWFIAVFLNRGKVAVVGNIGVMVRQHCAGELLNLRKGHRLPA
jgi:hypothetical protein